MKYISLIPFINIMRRHGWEYCSDGYINLQEYKNPQLLLHFYRCNCDKGKYLNLNELRIRFRFYKCTLWGARSQYAPEHTSIYAINHLFRADYDKFEEKIKTAIDIVHGSGIDYAFDYKRMRNNILRLKTYYHVMNDAGYYIAAVPVCCWIPLDNPLDFKIRCRNTGNCDGLRDYLTDLFYNTLSGVQLV